MASCCAKLRCGVVLMHIRGKPEEWRALPRLQGDAVLETVRDGLAASLKIAREAGIAEEAIVLDPGYGFGKRMEENYALLARQRDLLALGRPPLAGLSRKSFLSRTRCDTAPHRARRKSAARLGHESSRWALWLSLYLHCESLAPLEATLLFRCLSLYRQLPLHRGSHRGLRCSRRAAWPAAIFSQPQLPRAVPQTTPC